MSLFNWLLLGHLVADWLLQNDWIARNKQRRWFTLAILIHCTIYTFTLSTMLWLAKSNATNWSHYLRFALIIFLSHWLIDAGNLAGRWVRWLRQTRSQFVQVMVDQTMHLLVIAILVQTLVASN